MGYYETELPAFPKRPDQSWGDYWKERAEETACRENPDYADKKRALATMKKEWNERWPETLKDAHLLCDYAAELARKHGEPDQKFAGMKKQIKNNVYYAYDILHICEEIDRLK
jgi:hypothetical protein